MRIVIRDRRFTSSLRGKYTLDLQIDYPGISDKIPLTTNVLRQYQETKNAIGYTTFRGLNTKDIESILSAVKRQEAHVNVDRMGNCAFYKLHNPRHIKTARETIDSMPQIRDSKITEALRDVGL